MKDDLGKVRLHTIPVRSTGKRVVDPEEARRALISAIESIPGDQLRNFRTGQVTICM